MHQIRFLLGLCPRPRWGGGDSAPPDSIAGLKGLCQRRRTGRERGRGRDIRVSGGRGTGEGERGSSTHYFQLKSCSVGHRFGPHKNFVVVSLCLILEVFGRPFVKRFALCYRSVVLSVCLSCLYVLSVCLSVCNVGALWPNGWMDQDETWHAGGPRPWPHCVGWGPSFPSPKGHTPNFWPISVATKWLHGSRCHLVWT